MSINLLIQKQKDVEDFVIIDGKFKEKTELTIGDRIGHILRHVFSFFSHVNDLEKSAAESELNRMILAYTSNEEIDNSKLSNIHHLTSKMTQIYKINLEKVDSYQSVIEKLNTQHERKKQAHESKLEELNNVIKCMDENLKTMNDNLEKLKKENENLDLHMKKLTEENNSLKISSESNLDLSQLKTSDDKKELHINRINEQLVKMTNDIDLNKDTYRKSVNKLMAEKEELAIGMEKLKKENVVAHEIDMKNKIAHILDRISAKTLSESVLLINECAAAAKNNAVEAGKINNIVASRKTHHTRARSEVKLEIQGDKHFANKDDLNNNMNDKKYALSILNDAANVVNKAETALNDSAKKLGKKAEELTLSAKKTVDEINKQLNDLRNSAVSENKSDEFLKCMASYDKDILDINEELEKIGVDKIVVNKNA